ncbi:SDR family oxidoreductase [Oricola thermophila]|uniref:SDR family oxidoreductase n=1 Tax=Oricola thermophila TaxID=2742145 RepID=A0A6N1VFK8_9HYPH|nr:SDR family oxidoreductase [Oricola thermophila]QKV18385.1 SDR family oxidoreductase [Oricola thermophila]
MTSLFVTGCGRGIGLELVRQAMDLGWDVAGSVRDPEVAVSLERRFPERFRVFVFDVTDQQALRDAAAAYGGSLDILVNNAGVIGPGRQSTLDMDFDGFAETLAVNTLAPLRVVQAFLPNLRLSGSPRILTISSIMGRMSYAKSDRIAYRASKAAVNKVMQGLATDLLADGIAVRLLHPGWVRTDMGGPGADITPQESAAGILEIARTTTIADTGTFVNWDGTTVPW